MTGIKADDNHIGGLPAMGIAQYVVKVIQAVTLSAIELKEEDTLFRTLRHSSFCMENRGCGRISLMTSPLSFYGVPMAFVWAFVIGWRFSPSLIAVSRKVGPARQAEVVRLVESNQGGRKGTAVPAADFNVAAFLPSS